MIKVDESDPVGELEPSFPYKDITIRRGVDMKEHYELQSEIGRGKFGTVFKCREKATGLMLAAKFVGIVHKQDRRNVEREVEIMCELQHPRLIQLYDAFEANNAMCFILELVEGGELFERVIGDDFVLTEKAVTIFMRQICEGVQFIHSKNILHLDLKPENILCLTKTGNRIKIIDFGLARKFNPENKLQVLFGTPEFVAPEVVNFDAIGFGTDMWSVGVICYVLLSGLSPFMGETDVETMANVTVAQYDFDDEAFDSISNDAKDFIKKLLLKDHKSRTTATECLSHRWMQKKKPKRAVRKSSSKKLIKSAAGEKTKPAAVAAAKPGEDVAVRPLDVSKEHLKEFCSKSRSQSPAEVATSPSPSLAQLRIQRDCKSSKTGKSDDGPKATEVARGVDGESSPTTSGAPMRTVSGGPCDVPNGPKTTGGEHPHTASGEIKTVPAALQNDSGRGLESVEPRTVPDEPKTNEATEPLQSTSDGTQCISGKIIVHSTSKEPQKKTSDEIETVPATLHTAGGSGGPEPLPVDRLTQTVPEEPKTTADGSRTNEAAAESQPTSDGIQSTSGQQTKTSDGMRIVPVAVLQTISRGLLKPDNSAPQTTGGPAHTAVPDGSEIVTVGNLGNPFASGKGLESASEAPDGLQRRTSWSKTTVTTSAGYRRSSDASFVQFSSFRACTTTVRGPGGLSERLRAALLVDRASQAEGGGAQEPPTDRRPKFKFTNRDVPAGSPPPASNLMYYMQTSKQSSSCSRSAPLSKRASPEHESAKEMLLKLFYGDKNAESKLSI